LGSKQRQCGLRRNKYIDRLFSKERNHRLNQVEKQNKRLLMLVGDLGLGIGSRLWGFIKYGGKWKPQKNSLYSSVFYTNEHNTSQMCLRWFF
jgi:hypothetical protein